MNISHTGIVLDWEPPSEPRRGPSEPFRLNSQAPGILHPDTVVGSRRWLRKFWLDQRREGACTGFGAAHVLGSGRQMWLVDEGDARLFYKGAQRYDQWAGESYEGSSVHGTCDFLKKTGIINGYWWCNTLQELIQAVYRYGPVELGTNVYTGWFSPDSEGNIKNSGSREGGHAYAVGAIDLRKRKAEIWQSWGRGHGKNGTVYLDLDELGRLLEYENGECALFRKKKYDAGLLEVGNLSQ